MAQFPIYRTYIDSEAPTPADRAAMKTAVDRAKRCSPGLLNELQFIERFLLLDFAPDSSDEEKDEWIHFVMRLQQLTGPIMAKGFEDTTLYVYNRLLSLNEVGGRPNRFGVSGEAFHRFNRARAGNWPYTLNATATHDVKRGEDTRARINVLSEIPKEWDKHIRTWSRINRRAKKRLGSLTVPDRNDEYFLYQTLVGSFPFDQKVLPDFIERIKAYVIKAVREAKVHTAWLKPDTDYEEAFIAFVERILTPSDENGFPEVFFPFQETIAHYGMLNSLSQTLLKIVSPGVPDFYQGTELWDFTLVDPDNRGSVDFDKRNRFLRDILERTEPDSLELVRELLATREDGRIKLFLIYRALNARNKNISIFKSGEYIPLETKGISKNHIIAFARKNDHGWALALAPRFLTSLVRDRGDPLGTEVWHDTSVSLPDGAPGVWREWITNRSVETGRVLVVGEVLDRLPVALLMSEEVR
jgi:(1->4)-alpha-D-glucan 1-alpha-D-glucosylmutase